MSDKGSVSMAQEGRQHPGVDKEMSGGANVDMPPPEPVERSGSRPGSVQRLLEREGHNARNVVSWLVPNRTGGGGAGGGLLVDARTGGTAGRGQRGETRSRETSRERDHGR